MRTLTSSKARQVSSTNVTCEKIELSSARVVMMWYLKENQFCRSKRIYPLEGNSCNGGSYEAPPHNIGFICKCIKFFTVRVNISSVDLTHETHLQDQTELRREDCRKQRRRLRLRQLPGLDVSKLKLRITTGAS